MATIDNALRETIDLLHLRAEGRMDEQEPHYAQSRRSLLQSPYLATEGRDFLHKHRTLQRFWELTASNYGTYRARRKIVDDAFESTWLKLDEASISGIDVAADAPHSLNLEEVTRLSNKAKDRLERDDTDGAVTLARGLVESVAKRILDDYRQDYRANDTPAALCTQVLRLVLPAEAPARQCLIDISRRASGLVDAIAVYRDAVGDAHGSAHTREVERHQASYAVNIAASTAAFLVGCVDAYEVASFDEIPF